ncbi:MAG: lamin tail domain-containing protein [Verrucomicrobiales bacterium]|nr:lamin tail domain-containing protein [Verrucomicrobiales bacterium]
MGTTRKTYGFRSAANQLWLGLIFLAGLAGLPSVCASVVINEILYAPADKTKPTEFIELLNAADQPVDLSGWRFANAVEYTFPNSTLLPAHGFVVVAANPVAFQSAFGSEALGPWIGRLKRGGATIELRDRAGAIVDKVAYRPGFPWPSSAHGEGSSIELINASLDNDLGGAWRSSGSTNFIPQSTTYIGAQDSQWRFRKGTSEASNPTNAWRQIEFLEDETWQTAQTSIGFGDNDDKTDLSKEPWNVPVPMLANYISLYLRHPFTIPAGVMPSRLRLRVTIEDGCIVWINGREVTPRLHMRDKAEKPFDAGVLGRPFGATVHKAVSGGKPVIENLFISAKAAGLVAGTNLIAIHAFNSSISGTGVSIDCQVIGENAAPTPGAPNGAVAANAPPLIRQVSHVPEQPTAGVTELITAKVTDSDGVASVVLSYQVVDPGSYLRKTDPAYVTNWISVAMNDGGQAGDALPNDGVYSVTLPPEMQVHRRLVRYRILCTDTTGRGIQVPYPDDPQPNFAYFVYNGVPGWAGAFKPGDAGTQGVVNVFPSNLVASLPAYHLIANQSDVIRSQYDSAFDTVPMWGTLVYDGRVYDHVTFNNRGEFSTYVSGKNKWRIHVNNTHEFQAKDNYGRPYSQTWDDFNLNGGSAPWIAANRGMAGIEECLSFRVYELLGVPSPKTHYVSLRVIDNAVESADPTATVSDATFPGSGKGQYSGDLWGLYLVTESPDGSFLDERGLPDGSLYKIEGGGNGSGNKKNQGPTHPVNNADWDSFASASALSQKEGWWRTNLHLPTYYSFRIACRVVGNVDLRNGWNHYFYHHPEGHWMPIPWDLDMMFVGRTHQSASGAITQDGAMSVPALAIEKRNRAREVLDLLLSDRSANGGQIGQLVDEYAQLVNPSEQALTWADLDAAMWNFHPRTAGSPTAHSDSNHKGNFYYSPHTFNAGGGAYKRWLRATNYVGFAAFEDFVTYLNDYMTDTYPGPRAWTIGNGEQLGYGYEFVKSEAKESIAADVPSRPSIKYIGSPSYPANDLRFECSEFIGKTFAAVQWRLGRISAPGLAGYVAGVPRKYEVEPHWTSGEISTFAHQIHVPLSAVVPGETYRARVRHKDANGRWSNWSNPIQFVSTAANVTAYSESLVISELMYHPRAASPDELSLGFTDEDFEFIEIKNTALEDLDLTSVGFTSGVNFEFSPGTRLAAGSYGLVVKHQAAFEKRYGKGKNILGNYGDGNLKNAGELVTLSYGSNTPIRSVFYRDAAPWPSEADGTGRSLELIMPHSRPDHSIPENWRPSSAALGTPGGDDGLTFAAWGAAHGGVTDPLGDPDGDGLNNVLEYAFLGEPLSASSAEQPKAQVQELEVDGQKSLYFTLSFRGRTDASDLGYHVQESADLSQWKEDGSWVSRQPVGDGTARYLWRASKPLSVARRVFVRVHVTW